MMLLSRWRAFRRYSLVLAIAGLAACNQSDDASSSAAGAGAASSGQAGFGTGAAAGAGIGTTAPAAGTASDAGALSGAASPGSPAAIVQQARAFLARPEQDRDMQTALKARASGSPAACPSSAFVPGDTSVAANPPPQFDANGTMVRGSVRQRFTMIGCSSPLTLNVFVVTEPAMPTRTISGLSGTTIGSPDLQAEALPSAIAAARPLIPNCAQITAVDTRLVGADLTASGQPVNPWTEMWLMAGCGRLVSTTLHFTPVPATGHTQVRTDPGESRMVNRTG